MKYIGENAIKKLISLIKGDLATKQPTITASGLLKSDGAGTVTAADTQEATLVDVPNGLLKGDGTTISAAVAEIDYMAPPTGGTTGQILKKTETGTEWADTPFKPEGKSYLTFSSPNSFTLKVYDTAKHWDGTLEYFASDRTWTTWDGTTTLSSVNNDGEHVLYMRGTGNTVITGKMLDYRWVLIGSDISCIGNIENLLDYATVASGQHPTMANDCYQSMFSGCTSLTQAPALPATTLVNGCYWSMFNGCTSLTQAPALPATTLANYCYRQMFQGCTALTQVPSLPATTLKDYCYKEMFNGCTGLTQVPALPATTLATYCYMQMFQGCINIKLSSTKTEEYTQEYRIPMSETNGTGIRDSLGSMFYSTGGTFTGTPEINTTYYLSSDNMIVYNDNKVVTLNGYVGSMIDEVVQSTLEPLNKSVSKSVLLNNLKMSLPSTSSWSSVTFGNNRFVAVASGFNIAAYSDDGITWTQTELPSSEEWNSVTFGNNRFVAIADFSNIAAYSDDGITWTQTELPSKVYCALVTFGNNRFVAVPKHSPRPGENSNIAVYSDDGITWTQTTLPTAEQWTSVTFGNGCFVAVTDWSNIAVYSYDGITWTQISLPSNAYCSSVTFGNNHFVGVASGHNTAVYSDDGITWTQTELPSTSSWISVAFGNNRFIAIASNSNIAAYSDDGITWTQIELPSSEQWISVAFGDNRFVTIAARSTSAYSYDGINWYDNTDVLTYPDNTDIKDRIKNVLGIGQSISTEEVSSMIDAAIAAKMGSYTIKTVMDSVATPHTQYYLGNQTAVDIVLPDSANVGQIITVCWYNGETAATLSITGTMLDFDFAPSANTRSEINALWDGRYWAVLGNEMAVPSEVTA